MLKENYDLEKALCTYLMLLENKAYFYAHEALEEAWHPLRKANHPLKNLVKGLINGAICFEHIKRDKNDAKRKARQVLKSFERYKHLSTKNIEHDVLFKESCKKIEELKRVYEL